MLESWSFQPTQWLHQYCAGWKLSLSNFFSNISSPFINIDTRYLTKKIETAGLIWKIFAQFITDIMNYRLQKDKKCIKEKERVRHLPGTLSFSLIHFLSLYLSRFSFYINKLQKELFKRAAIGHNTVPKSVRPFIVRCTDDNHRMFQWLRLCWHLVQTMSSKNDQNLKSSGLRSGLGDGQWSLLINSGIWF